MNSNSAHKGILNSFIIFLVLFFLCLPVVVSAQNNQSDLIKQINQLKQQVNQLQERLVSQTTSGSQTNGDVVTGIQPFTSNLSRGMTGLEVKRLQQALNQTLTIPVAATGSGSIGQETTYYGPATANAVSRFQELYAEEVLVPNDLQQGTGYFGNSTRTKLNNLLAQRNDSNLNDVAKSQQFDSYVDSSQDTLQSNEKDIEDEITELENKINLDKWDLTEREKRQVAMSVPEEIRGEYFPEYVDGGSGESGGERTNPLLEQQEYQRRLQQQSSAVDKLRGIALSFVTDPLERLHYSLKKIFPVPETAHAQLSLVFGGRIAAVFPCTCNPPAIHFTVIGARPASTVYFPGVTQKSPPWPPVPGAGTLGNYTPFGICLVGVPPACAPTPAFGTAIIMGTSF